MGLWLKCIFVTFFLSVEIFSQEIQTTDVEILKPEEQRVVPDDEIPPTDNQPPVNPEDQGEKKLINFLVFFF